MATKKVILTLLVLGVLLLSVTLILNVPILRKPRPKEKVLRFTSTSPMTGTSNIVTSSSTPEISQGCFNASTVGTSDLVLLDSCQLMIGDGFCDDICNYPEMDFDGGDCCRDTIDNTYCLTCFCFQDCSKHPLNPEIALEECFESNPNNGSSVCSSSWISDGFCDDGCNEPTNNYDGGDCCLDIVTNNWCSDCFCYNDCNLHAGSTVSLNSTQNVAKDMHVATEICRQSHPNPTATICYTKWINDGICDDECNLPSFSFDGGDCCLDYIFSRYCSDCFCYQDCSYHNDGVPPDVTVCIDTQPNDADQSQCQRSMTKNEICEDECNFHEWNFDGGACCLEKVIDTICSDCFCYQDCTYHNSTSNESTLSEEIRGCMDAHPTAIVVVNVDVNNWLCRSWFKDGECDDRCNIPAWNFDGGDCCLETVDCGKYYDSSSLDDCFCYQDCSYHNLTIKNPLVPSQL